MIRRMKVTQSPLLNQVQRDPQALRELLLHLLKRDDQHAEDTVTLQNKTYTIRRSPTLTQPAEH